MFQVNLGSEYESRIDAEVFQMPTDLDRCILTVRTRCDLGPAPGHIFGLDTVQFHGTRDELRDLAGLIQDAIDKLKDPVEPVEYVAGDNHSALFDATDIEESLKGRQG